MQAAIDELPALIPGADVVGAALLGGGEKLSGPLALEVPVVDGPSAAAALAAAVDRFRPDLVVDLSDEPVVDARTRLRLAAHTLLAGAPYQGADFRLDPPPNGSQVLAYEKDEFQLWHNRLVLFADGSVQMMTTQDFEAALKQ